MSRAKKIVKKKPKIRSKKAKETLERKTDDPLLNLPKIPDLPKPKVNSEK